MRLLARFRERRDRKAHQRYLAERARQEELSGQDAQQAVRDTVQQAAPRQGQFGPGV